MLLKITAFADLDGRKLMDVYAESNLENTDYFCPEEPDKQVALRKVEAGFLTFLRDGFFRQKNAVCWVLEQDGLWVSALRTCQVDAKLYFLEALETHPEHRQKGCGALLLSGVLEAMKAEGSFRLCDCVGKKNLASLKTHEKCGFRIVSQQGYDYLHGDVSPQDFGMEYQYSKA